MNKHQAQAKIGLYAIFVLLFIILAGYFAFSKTFFCKSEIIENEEFGKVIDWKEGHGYLAILIKYPDEKVGTLVFERRAFNFYSKIPYFKSEPSNASYENTSVLFKGRILFIEFGVNKEARSVEIIYFGNFANQIFYENGYFLRVLDDKNDTNYGCPERHVVHEIRLRDENGSVFETIPIQ